MKNQDKLFQAYQKVFNTPDGKVVLTDLCNHFHVLGIAKGADAYETYFKDGQRSVAMHILAHLSMDLIRFRQLMKDQLGGNDGDSTDI